MKNIPEFSVSEITSLTKNILEENFERVRIRGEVCKIKENKGHLYFSLKRRKFYFKCYLLVKRSATFASFSGRRYGGCC
jgi:exonuclease VII large subunit